MKNQYTNTFDKYVYAGDTIESEKEGLAITARIVFDQDSHINDDDSHNTDQTVTGCNNRQQAKLLAAREAWFNDKWFYCGIVLSVSKNGLVLDSNAASLWSIEANYPGSDNSYLTHVANELLDEAINQGQTVLETLRS